MAKRNFNPKYSIDPIKVFNRAYAGASTALRNKLRPYLSDPTFRRMYADAVIEEIEDRTSKKSIDKNSDPFKTYSPKYRKSLKFQIYRGGGTKVTLKLTGAMLASMVENKRATKNLIFQFADQDNRNKAQGHISGDIGVKRDFFGLPSDVEEKLMKDTFKIFRNLTGSQAEEVLLAGMTAKSGTQVKQARQGIRVDVADEDMFFEDIVE